MIGTDSKARAASPQPLFAGMQRSAPLLILLFLFLVSLLFVVGQLDDTVSHSITNSSTMSSSCNHPLHDQASIDNSCEHATQTLSSTKVTKLEEQLDQKSQNKNDKSNQPTNNDKKNNQQQAMSQEQQSPPSAVIIQKPLTDDRTYHHFVLETNQLPVLLISDPNAEKSTAAMDIHVGHLNDPEEVAGLAHFCEHMLFLGTEKYPEEGSYQKLYVYLYYFSSFVLGFSFF